MGGVLDNSFTIGKETTYGTAIVPTRGIEGQADTWKLAQEQLQSTGFRRSMQAALSARRTSINMGGEGTLDFEILDNGFGMILQGMLGSVSGPTQNGATAAYTTTAATTADDPNDFFTVQKAMEDMSGTLRTFTHKGCVITGWKIAQAVNEMVKAEINFDFQDVDTSSTAGTPAYPDGTPFNWSQAVASIDSVNTDIKSFELNADLGLNTDRRFLRGSALKKQPCRSTVPQFNGVIDMEFEDLTLYTDFVNGTIVPIVMTWTGPNISGAFNNELKITMPACKFTGESPEMSLTDNPMQSLPFDVLWNESAAAVTIEYTSTDTAL